MTHPHPDHYNTITALLAGDDVPVIAHRDVDAEIRAKDDAKRVQWGPMFGDEWPASATFPNRTVADEESVELGDLRFTAWDFGPGESESETVWLLGDGDTAFIGDLAFNGTHAYLADGRTDAWLRAIDRAEDSLASVRTLYVGHGPPAVPAVLADQRRYLLMAREAIGRLAGGRPQLGADEANRVARLMERYLPNAPLGWLITAGASRSPPSSRRKRHPHDRRVHPLPDPRGRGALVRGRLRARAASLDASPHCQRYEVARCTEDPTAYTVRIEWDSAEGHMQGFRGSPGFAGFFAAVRPYVDRIQEMRHYDVRTAGG